MFVERQGRKQLSGNLNGLLFYDIMISCCTVVNSYKQCWTFCSTALQTFKLFQTANNVIHVDCSNEVPVRTDSHPDVSMLLDYITVGLRAVPNAGGVCIGIATDRLLTTVGRRLSAVYVHNGVLSTMYVSFAALQQRGETYNAERYRLRTHMDRSNAVE